MRRSRTRTEPEKSSTPIFHLNPPDDIPANPEITPTGRRKGTGRMFFTTNQLQLHEWKRGEREEEREKRGREKEKKKGRGNRETNREKERDERKEEREGREKEYGKGREGKER
ncbi:hypothetical protein WMY93_024418 [Mugilogobius chulae]|uniref:Uncharacterized protein n=1 Tax=Mugilogobius chulae TaxID=88201 RepID=A0AAW0N189_9GOBI